MKKTLVFCTSCWHQEMMYVSCLSKHMLIDVKTGLKCEIMTLCRYQVSNFVMI